MKRLIAITLLVVALPSFARTRKPASPFPVVEATIPQMQQAMQEGRITSRELVMQYLARIAKYEDRLNAVMTVNPKALEEAA
ncbi:MAG TPA: amidase, partial [Thermoanaerobaculia bacterium]|nr:amidase [Thermoanaerobaculia bacterium]